MKFNKLFLSAVILAVIFSASGCVRAYHIQVDSISDRSAVLNKVYQIMPGNNGVNSNDLQFKEYAGLLVNVMAMQGYTYASASQPAEMEIYLSYGIGEPEKHTYSYTVPVWGQTGTDVYTQTNTVANPANTASTQYSTTYVEPQYGVTGYTEQTGEYTSYKKYVILDAYDIKNGKPGSKLSEVWKVSLSGAGKINDLRKIYPALLAASVNYIGTSTGEVISVDIPADSEVIKAIKGN